MEKTDTLESGRASVNGLSIYYEIHGAGEPLVMLHGGVGGIEMFGAVLPELARRRRVIGIELQGHGRSSDSDRPLTYEAVADDVAGVIEHLDLDQTDAMGYSLGAGTALQLAIRHPKVVRRLIVVSQPFRRDGWYPEVLASMAQMGPEAAKFMKQSPLAERYPDMDWARLFAKLGDLLRKDYDWSKQVAAIRSRMMIVFADADSVRTEHIAEFFGLLGGGKRDAGLDGSLRPAAQLAILPGLTHYTICAAPALAATVAPFLEASIDP